MHGSRFRVGFSDCLHACLLIRYLELDRTRLVGKNDFLIGGEVFFSSCCRKSRIMESLGKHILVSLVESVFLLFCAE